MELMEGSNEIMHMKVLWKLKSKALLTIGSYFWWIIALMYASSTGL